MGIKRRECEKCRGVMYVVRILHDESIETCWQCANCWHKKEFKPRMSAKRKAANALINNLVQQLEAKPNVLGRCMLMPHIPCTKYTNPCARCKD
jgi:hypothetical protein